MMSGAGTLRGLNAFRAAIHVFPDAFPEIEFSVDTWIEAGDTLVAEGRVKGTHTGPLKTPQGEMAATGRRLDLTFVDILRARGDRISLLHVYFDRLEMMSQLGLIPGQD
jgi:predicted ester cyclase